MINNINPSRLVRRMTEALEIGGDGFVLSQLADDYAALCKETAERVGQCAFLLERGDEFGAWKLASTPPDLLDLVAVLGFPREGEWRTLCKERGFVVPAPFDEPSVARIGELYSKSINQSHPLYNAYRAAVRKRDETAALFAINAIVRKNPDDPHAREEKARLTAKRAAARAEELAVVVERGNVDEICRCLEVIESQGDAGAVNETLLARARALREEHVRKVESSDAVRRIAHLKTLNPQTETEVVGELVARITQAQEEFGFTLSPGDTATLAGARETLVAIHREREIQRKQEVAVRALESAMAAIEEALLRGDKSPAEMTDERAKLHRLGRELDDVGRSAPAGLLARVQALDGRIDAARRKKQLRRTLARVLAASVVIAGLVATGVAVQRSRVEDKFVHQFAALRETGTVGEATALLQVIEKENPELAQRPELAGAMNATRQWADAQARQAERSDVTLQELERRVTDFGAGSTLEQATALPPLLADAEKTIVGLAKDMRGERAERLERTKAAYQEKQQTWAQAQQQQIETVLVAAERALAGIEACRRQSEVETALPALVESSDRMEALFKEIQATVALSPAQLERARAVRLGLEKWRQNSLAWQEVRSALSTTADYAAYGDVLQKLTQLLPATDPLIGQAAVIQAGWAQLDPAQLQQAILFADDPAAQAFVRANPAMKPEPAAFPAFPPERAVYNAMKSAVVKNDLWSFRLLSAKGDVVTLHSLEKPSHTDFPMPDGREIKLWTVQLIVRLDGDQLVSEPATYKGSFKDGKLTDGWAVEGVAFAPEQEFSRRYLGEDGINLDNGRFTVSPIKMLDILYATPDLSPVFVTYVEQEIFKILDFRPYNWGVHLSPTLQSYRTAFKARLTRAMQPLDWVLPSQGREAEFAKLSALRPRGFLTKEQEINGSLVREILTGKIVWAGSVATDGKASLQPWARNALVFGLSSRGGRLWRGLGSTVTDGTLAPLSPLLSYSTGSGLSVEEIQAGALRAYSPGDEKNKIRLIDLF